MGYPGYHPQREIPMVYPGYILRMKINTHGFQDVHFIGNETLEV